MTHSRFFQMLVERAFVVCDDTGDGVIDEAELYAGLLLVHLKLAKHAGPAACFPPTREICDNLFQAADVDHSGGLDKDQFQWIMKILCAQILSRMMVFYVMMVLGVPVLGSIAVSLLGVPEGTYLEQAIRVGISMGTFFLVIPVLWNAVDDCSENQENVSETIGASESMEALLVPSKREEQRQRRRLRRNRTSQQDGETAIGK